MDFAVAPGGGKALAMQRGRGAEIGLFKRENVEFGAAGEVVGKAHRGRFLDVLENIRANGVFRSGAGHGESGLGLGVRSAQIKRLRTR